MDIIVVTLQDLMLNITWLGLDIENEQKIKDHFAQHSIRLRAMYKDHIL